VPAEGATSAAAAADTATADAAAAAEATKPAEIRVNLAGLRRNQTASSTSSMAATASEADKAAPKSMKDIVKATPDFTGFAADEGLDWSAIGKGIDRRLASFNRTQYEQANAANRHMRTQLGFAVINKPFEDDLIVKSSDPIHIDEILHRAAKESRLPGNSLVAAGGWCAPSQTVYDLLELESRDGLYSLPEIGITRGGIHFTSGPDFASIYANTGFSYNETQDIAGDYNGAGGGSKPCYEVACPPFSEQRLSYDGVCISAGLLQQRGYPEVIARTVRGALVAHDHKLAGHVLGAVVAGSDAVSMAANQVGATAPILTAIDLQVEHYRNVTRLGRNVSLEAVFPFWVRGAIRADLARRLGVDLLDVSDARIDGWFADRGVAPQYVYNWQDLTGAASTVTAFPTSVEFLLYAAGTWVKGGADIITLDTIYDSVKLGTNDFTALFSEEGWLVAKMGHDSRVVTVPICPDGATHGGVSIDCNGAQSATAQV
jgi:soluble cytochrome b562